MYDHSVTACLDGNLVSTLLIIVSSHCIFLSLMICDHLESRECLLLLGNPGDNLSGVLKTIMKEGLIPIHFLIRSVSLYVCRYPLWYDLLTDSLSCILSYSSLVSLSFSSLTICAWLWTCSGNGWHIWTWLVPVAPTPRCCRQWLGL